MPAFSYIKRILTITLFLPLVVFGQASLKGTVTDGTTDETLIGVNVIIQGTSLGASTDIEGQFRIVGIPARVFKVKISYVGYEPKILEIDFSKTQDVSTNVQLKPAIIEGEEVIVTAQMRGQLAAINQQLTSKTIVNVVSEEKIQELPDANAAEAIGRLPGVSIIRSGGEASQVVLRGLSSKYSNINLDGVKIPATDPNSRDVDLSVMSQGSLAGIELFKTLTPDQDADAIAGTINLVTRKAPSDRLIRFEVKGDYNDLMKTMNNQYDLTGRYGERYFNDLVGLQLQAGAEKKIRNEERTRYIYQGTDQSQILGGDDYRYTQFTAYFNDELRTRNSGQIILDVNTPDSGSVKASGSYSETGRKIMTSLRNYPAGASSSGWAYQYEYQEQNIKTFNTSLQGQNYLLGFNVDWNIAFAESKIGNPIDYRLLFDEINGGTGEQARDHPELHIRPNNNFNAALLDSSKYLSQENYEKENTYFLNLSRKVTFANYLASNFKGGIKYKERTRWMGADGYRWNNYPGNPFAANVDFTGTRFAGANTNVPLNAFIDPNNVAERTVLGYFQLTPIINTDALREWYALTAHGVVGALNQGEDATLLLSDYNVTEKVTSGYLMSTLEFGNLATLILGVRVEKEKNDYRAFYLNGNPFGSYGGTGSVLTIAQGTTIPDTNTVYTETNWLPSAQLLIKAMEAVNVRFAVYGALARPDYSDRLPRFSYNSNNKNLFVGNLWLKDAKALNLETSVQISSGTIGLFTVSGFYKKIDHLTHQMNGMNFQWPDYDFYAGQVPTLADLSAGAKNWNLDPTYRQRLENILADIAESNWYNTPAFNNTVHNGATYNLFTAYSSKDPSYLWGIEIEHQMNFSFLPVSWLRNIVLSYNLTFTRSETNILVATTQRDSVINFEARRGVVIRTIKYPTGYYAQWAKSTIENQPKFYGNIALGYDIGGLSARFSLFYNGLYLRQASGLGTADNYTNEFIKCDLSVKYQLNTLLAFMLNVNNIFNRQDVNSQYNQHYDWGYIPTSQDLYGASVDFGVRLNL
jgi:TonB-dependent receptor